MQTPKKSMIVVAVLVVVLVSTPSFMDRASVWGARRIYALDPRTLNLIAPTFDSSTTQFFTINFLNKTTGDISGTMNISNEDGSPQITSPIPFTAAPNVNFQFQYKPPEGTVILPGSTIPTVVGAPMVPSITFTVPPGADGSVCANVELRDDTPPVVTTVQGFGILETHGIAASVPLIPTATATDNCVGVR
jgi:hypothetical protein